MSLALVPAVPLPRAAVDCQLTVLDACLQALRRVWNLSCATGTLTMTKKSASYPPSTIGCSTKSPPIVPINPRVTARLLNPPGSGEARLKNEWSLKSFEVLGDQWSPYNSSVDLIAFTHEVSAPNTSYNLTLKQMILTKGGGVCGNVIEKAF